MNCIRLLPSHSIALAFAITETQFNGFGMLLPTNGFISSKRAIGRNCPIFPIGQLVLQPNCDRPPVSSPISSLSNMNINTSCTCSSHQSHRLLVYIFSSPAPKWHLDSKESLVGVSMMVLSVRPIGTIKV